MRRLIVIRSAPCIAAPQRFRSALGFTIVELIFVMVILAILITLAAPSMGNLVRDQRVKTAAGDVYAALVFARSEAIKRNQFVGVCSKNAAGTNCSGSTNWALGWIVFLDPDGDGAPSGTDLNLDGIPDDILKSQDSLADLVLTGTGTNVSYQGDGRLRAAATPFVISSPGNNAITARCVRLDLAGRPNIHADTDKDPGNGCN